MRTNLAAGMAVAAALIAGGLGACGTEEPDAPPTSPRTSMETSVKPETPTAPETSETSESRKPTRAPSSTPERTRDRPLPEECKHPAGGSVRQSCIEEFGPDGVGSVEPVPPERDRNGNGIDDSVEEAEPEPSEDETTVEPEPSESESEEQVPSKEEQIEECIEQTGNPEGCREKIAPESP